MEKTLAAKGKPHARMILDGFYYLFLWLLTRFVGCLYDTASVLLLGYVNSNISIYALGVRAVAQALGECSGFVAAGVGLGPIQYALSPWVLRVLAGGSV